VRCGCQSDASVERRRRYLEGIDGLLPQERTRSFSDAMRVGKNGDAVGMVEQAVEVRRGLVTLFGPPGLGKTHLLMCAVNEARARNVLACYTTVTDLLDYLRQAFDPRSEVSFDRRWDTLVRCDVLALDELSEFNTTAWAMERFLRLIDERWRNMDRVLTLCATNGRINTLPDKVASRLTDGRARVIEMKGIDMRKVMG
jgi:DNA replication protein DnaC